MTELISMKPYEREWLQNQGKELETALLHSLQKSSKDLVVQDVTLVHNSMLLDRFMTTMKTKGNVKLLFHGTNTQYYDSIFEKGFLYKGTNDDGYFGLGYYFTSFPDYALFYKNDSGHLSPGNATTLVASYVALGNSYRVRNMVSNSSVLACMQKTEYPFNTGLPRQAHPEARPRLALRACLDQQLLLSRRDGLEGAAH